MTGMLRSLVIEVLGLHGDTAVVQEANNRFNQLANQNDNSILHPDLRQPVYSIVLQSADENDRYNNKFSLIFCVFLSLSPLPVVSLFSLLHLLPFSPHFFLSNSTTFETIMKLYKVGEINEKLRCLHALGFTRNTSLLRQLLSFSLSEDVRHQV